MPPILCTPHARPHRPAHQSDEHQWVQSELVSDQITVRIPASTPHVGLVRATASALAALLDFTYDQISDLHLAIDEVCGRILATSNPSPTRLEVTFRVEGDTLSVEACGDTPIKPGEEFFSNLSRAILAAVTQGMDLTEADGVVCASFRLVKG
jgi:hypothetical protein